MIHFRIVNQWPHLHGHGLRTVDAYNFNCVIWGGDYRGVTMFVVLAGVGLLFECFSRKWQVPTSYGDLLA